MSSHNQANVERFSGFADTYDSYRPQPPVVIVDILTQIAGVPKPALVADLGSGTGLSTRIWSARAEEVIGIEPNADMRARAEQVPTKGTICYREGTSTNTGLADGCADIVTVSQAFHWMDPIPTLAEVARILRPGGVFATIDCDWPPTINPEAETAYKAFMEGIKAFGSRPGVAEGVDHRPKDEHLANIRDSGHFRYVKELAVHSIETGDAERLVGLALSFGGVASVLKSGLTEEEIGVDRLREETHRAMGEGSMDWYFTYRIRLGCL